MRQFHLTQSADSEGESTERSMRMSSPGRIPNSQFASFDKQVVKTAISSSVLPAIAEADALSPDLTPKLRDLKTNPVFPGFVHQTEHASAGGDGFTKSAEVESRTIRNDSERIYLTFETNQQTTLLGNLQVNEEGARSINEEGQLVPPPVVQKLDFSQVRDELNAHESLPEIYHDD